MIFPFLWRILPGPTALRITILLAALVVLTWACFEAVFPWIATLLPAPDASVGD